MVWKRDGGRGVAGSPVAVVEEREDVGSMFVAVCGVMCALQLFPKPGRKSMSLKGDCASNALASLSIDRSVKTDRSGTTLRARALEISQSDTQSEH